MSLYQKRINLLITEIEEYTKGNADLWACHHFLFDKPLTNAAYPNGLDFLVMGMNPGETEYCRRIFPKPHNSMPLEETSRRNDLLSEIQEKSSVNWQKKCINILGDKNITLGEMFFWSTPKDGCLLKLFSRERLAKHYKFCASINKKMVEIRKPKAIIFPGISKEAQAVNLYDLKPAKKDPVYDHAGRGKLLSIWNYQEIPWIFTKHWTGARLSNVDLGIIRTEIQSLINI